MIIWFDNRERELAHLSFPLAQVELQGMQSREGLNALSHVVSGRILNHSPVDPLHHVKFEVTVKDCEDGVCQVVAQEKGRISLEVPPGQARDFQVSVPFSTTLKLQGQSEWEYRVVDVNDR